MRTEKIFLSTFITVWPLVLTGVLVTFLVTRDRDMAINFFLGGVTSIMLMSHNYKTTMKTANTDATLLQKRAVMNYIFRYAFYILILTITFFRFDSPSYLIPVFLGFTSFKVAMVLTFTIHRLILAKKGVDIDA